MQTLFWTVGIIATVLLATVEHFSRTTLRPPLKMTAAGAFLAIGFSGDHAGLPQQLLMLGLIFSDSLETPPYSLKIKKPFLFGIGRISHRSCPLRKLPGCQVSPQPRSPNSPVFSLFYLHLLLRPSSSVIPTVL